MYMYPWRGIGGVLGSLGGVWKRLGAFWSFLGGVVGPFGGFLERLGATWTCLAGVLGVSWKLSVCVVPIVDSHPDGIAIAQRAVDEASEPLKGD